MGLALKLGPQPQIAGRPATGCLPSAWVIVFIPVAEPLQEKVHDHLYPTPEDDGIVTTGERASERGERAREKRWGEGRRRAPGSVTMTSMKSSLTLTWS